MVTRQVARKTVKEHITYDKPKRDARMRVSADKYEDYTKSKKKKGKNDENDDELEEETEYQAMITPKKRKSKESNNLKSMDSKKGKNKKIEGEKPKKVSSKIQLYDAITM